MHTIGESCEVIESVEIAFIVHFDILAEENRGAFKHNDAAAANFYPTFLWIKKEIYIQAYSISQ